MREKDIDVTDAVEIELNLSIAVDVRYIYLGFIPGGVETLTIVRVKHGNGSIAIDSSCDREFEYQLAEMISKRLSLPLSVKDDIKQGINRDSGGY